MFAYTLLVVVVFATAAHAFTLTMKTAPGASSTISRKIKRNIYSATSAEGLSKIYTPENDLYTFLPLTFISPRFASLPFTEPKFLTSIHFTSLRLNSLHLSSPRFSSPLFASLSSGIPSVDRHGHLQEHNGEVDISCPDTQDRSKGWFRRQNDGCQP